MNSDLETVRRYAGTRDAEAFSALVEKYQGLVYGACYRILRNSADAEDATQEAFLGLARDAASIRSSVAGWLHRRATTTAIDLIKQKQSRDRREKAHCRMKAAERHDASWEEVAPALDRALDELPDDLRHLLVQHFLLQRPQVELAKELGKSKAVVSRRVAAGVEALRKKLKKMGVVVAGAVLVTMLAQKTAVAVPAAVGVVLGKIALSGFGGASTAAATAASQVAATSTAASAVLLTVKAKIVAVAVAGAIVAGGVTTYVATRERTHPPPNQGGGQMQAATEITRAFMLLSWYARCSPRRDNRRSPLISSSRRTASCRRRATSPGARQAASRCYC